MSYGSRSDDLFPPLKIGEEGSIEHLVNEAFFMASSLDSYINPHPSDKDRRCADLLRRLANELKESYL